MTISIRWTNEIHVITIEMSYIRSNSNPENLYVINNGEGIEICWNDGKLHAVHVSREAFEELMDKYDADGDDVIFVDGMSYYPMFHLENPTNGNKPTIRFDDYLDEELSVYEVTLNTIVDRMRYDRFRDSFWERLRLLFDPLRYYANWR